MFNVITGLNESKILTKYIYITNVNVDLMEKNAIQINCGITIVCENDYIWNPATCSCEKENI